jgi:ribosomal RNA assembly protein
MDSIEENDVEKPKNHNKYRRDKPWDNKDIDHWKLPDWKEGA